MKKPAFPGLFVLSGLVLLLDRLTKAFVHQAPWHEPVVVIPGFLQLVKVWNVGLAFGTFSEASARLMNPLIVGLGLVAVGWLMYLLLFSKPCALIAVSFHLLLAGAAGNIWDRLRYGAVLDFLDFHIGVHHWPCFNISDSAITVGLALLIWDMVIHKDKT